MVVVVFAVCLPVCLVRRGGADAVDAVVAATVIFAVLCRLKLSLLMLMLACKRSRRRPYGLQQQQQRQCNSSSK